MRVKLRVCTTIFVFAGTLECTTVLATNPLDGVTPHALKPGVPSGSYALSGFDSVNYYAGAVNLALPVLTIAGRGDVSHSLTLAVTPPNWTMNIGLSADSQVSPGGSMNRTFTADPSADWWHPYRVGYGPGLVMIKRSVANLIPCGTGSSQVYQYSLTHVAFIGPGESEIPLYSTSSVGASVGSSGDCSVSVTTRGKTFEQAGGGGIRFVATQAIADIQNPDSVVGTDATWPEAANGTLYFPDGQRAEVTTGRITKKWDRHGNRITFDYRPAGGSYELFDVMTITDALGRVYTIDYDYTDTQPYGVVDRIRYRPNNTTAEQIIRIKYGTSSGKIRSDLPVITDLFHESLRTVAALPRVPYAVYLPNGTAYSFAYTSYGELAQVVLPTGGQIQYDYTAGLDCTLVTAGCYTSGQVLDSLDSVNFAWSTAGVAPSHPAWGPIIYRRLTQRREYTDGQTISRTATISRPEKAVSVAIGTGTPYPASRAFGITIGRDPYVEVAETGSNGASATTRHYFYANSSGSTGLVWPQMDVTSDQSKWEPAGPAVELLSRVGGPDLSYADPFVGREFRTENPALRRIDVAFSTAVLPTDVVEVCQRTETLLGTNNTSAASGSLSYYDVRANLLDNYEFEYNTAPAISDVDSSRTGYKQRTCPAQSTVSVFFRHTATQYKTDSSYVDTPAYLPHLTSQVTVYGTDSVHPVSDTGFTYDAQLPDSTTTPVNWDEPLNSDQTAGRVERGNATSASRVRADLWGPSFTTYTNVSDTRKYDRAGNLISYTDPRGNETKYDYTDNCTGGSPTGPLLGFLTKITFPAANSLNLTQKWSYDCYLGRPLDFTDRDAVKTSFTYETDALKLNRLKTITKGGKTTFNYHDDTLPNWVQTVRDQYRADDNALAAKTYFDGFGREYQTDSGTNSVITNKRDLDGFGRVYREYRPSSANYKQFEYDGLGRVTKLTDSADSSFVKSEYVLNTITNTDEDGKATKRTLDAAGRSKRLEENPTSAPTYLTEYAYSAADKLLSVTQKGDQSAVPAPKITTRMFDYDTLGRLRRAYNPERNAVATPTTYGYDENSNLTERKESDSATVSLTYDVLNRLTSKTYVPPAGASDSFTPTATWCYDGTTFSGANCNQAVNQNSYWKLTEARSSVSSTIYTHDSLGRLLTSTQTTSPLPGQAFTYAYYLDDNVASVQYPSGKSVATCYDEHGRPVWVSKVKTAADCSAATPSAPSATDAYVSSAQYEPHGGLKQMQSGNLLWQSATYNGRLQPQTMSLGTTSTTGDLWQQTYDYGTHNNGNIRSLQMALPNQATVRSDYLYDPVNRLTGAVENGNVAATPLCGSVNGQWCQEYGYDHQGNRSITRETGLGSASGVPSTFGSSAHPGEMDNRIADSGWAYDGRGNLIQRPGTSLSDKFLYDVEGRIIAVCASTNGSCSDAVMAPGKTVYSYDAEGRRVRKQNNTSGATTYVYDGQGQLTAEYGLPASVTGTQYLTTDHLGNTRVIGGGAERHDYLPFGEEITVSAGNPRYGQQGYGTDVAATLKFTGKERDAETGLDYFGARYYSAAQGRFTSPDEFPGGIVDPFTGQQVGQPGPLPYADITDPQTLNKYAYVRNNPLRFVDPDGHCIWDVCAVEAMAVTGAVAGTAAAIRWLQTPGGQEATRTFIQGTGLLINKATDSLSNLIFSKGQQQNQPQETGQKNEEMLGAKGTQTPSVTVGKDVGNGVRVDVENPNPGQRPGQIQVQRGEGKGKDTLLYDPKTGKITRPGSVNPSDTNRISNTELGKITKTRDFQKAIEKARKILGEQ